MSARPGGSLTGTTVVIADDDEVSRALLRGVLLKSGLEVLAEVSDGTQALAAFEQHSPQVVCLDIEMPGMSGLDVLARIRATGQKVVILMISAITTEMNVLAAKAASADGVLAKPFSAARVTQEIERALAERGFTTAG
jgi:two-component system, chemotaxis family, chemotaxis protein CheY